MLTLKDFQREEQPNWCPTCGNFGIILSVKKALMELNVPQEETVLVSGVGCFAKLPYWIKAYGFVGLHGRSLPVAQGVKLANSKLKVIAFGGDGDGYGEGGNHFIHACRRNVNIAYFVHNNGVFGLTTGQYSPTSKKGTKSKSSPSGSEEMPVNPLALAIASGAKFVARAYSGDPKGLVEIMKKAIEYEGFAFVDIMQSCITFGKEHDYFKDKIYHLDDSYDASDKVKAMGKALDYEETERFALGIIYQEL
ncbi:2-oxoacid ferredoxin oxidoreductase [Candidatus Woesearchaeota archaeon]|nr:2-oxoacid ferredoxin oxidoreductase [Candidatus Woesearchaeota archaeon]